MLKNAALRGDYRGEFCSPISRSRPLVCTSTAAAVCNLLKSLAGELVPAIRVNSIVLGLVDSQQWQRRFDNREDKSVGRGVDMPIWPTIPLGRLHAQPEEAARALIFWPHRR